MADFSKVIQLDSEFDEAYNQIAMTTYYKGNWAAAEKSFNEYVAKFSTHSHAYYNRAMFYAERKQYNKAILDFDYCLKLNPKDGDAFFHKGMVLLELQKPEEACEAFTESEKLGHGDAILMRKKNCNTTTTN